jgi:hypothetical protein
MAKRGQQYLDGVMTAAVAIAKITGEQPIEGMSDREWELIGKINLRIIEMAKEAAEEIARD